MRYRNVAWAGAFGLTVVLIGSPAVTVRAQGPKAARQNAGVTKTSAKAPAAAKIPRTPEGKPDLQGIWSAFILTPLQRPVGAPEAYTPEQVAARQEKDRQDRQDLRFYSTVTPPGEKTTDAYNTFWRDGFFTKIGAGSHRSSQIVDPPDGRLPPTTPEARQRQQEASMRQNRPAWGPEDRPLWTRCVRGQVSGPPLVGTTGSYNNDLQIVQNARTMVIVQEMIHESQIVPLDGRPHTPSNVRLYKGDSVGHWESDTLVIDTTNFAPGAVTSIGGGGNTDRLHVVERYKLLDANNLLYGFTVEDPGTFTKPWSAEFVMWRMKDQKMLVEYACHEGNRSLEYALSGARALEKEGRVSGQPIALPGDEDEVQDDER